MFGDAEITSGEGYYEAPRELFEWFIANVPADELVALPRSALTQLAVALSINHNAHRSTALALYAILEGDKEGAHERVDNMWKMANLSFSASERAMESIIQEIKDRR